jgi:transcriptional regulator with XRE-family HTH domain
MKKLLRRTFEGYGGQTMANIWNFVQFKPSERPKYTRYELAKMVSDKRNNLGLKIEEFSREIGIETNLLRDIENASRSFNAVIYQAISKILEMSPEELLVKDCDNTQSISFRSKEMNKEIETTVKLANLLFDEIVMQEKISIR